MGEKKEVEKIGNSLRFDKMCFKDMIYLPC